MFHLKKNVTVFLWSSITVPDSKWMWTVLAWTEKKQEDSHHCFPPLLTRSEKKDILALEDLITTSTEPHHFELCAHSPDSSIAWVCAQHQGTQPCFNISDASTPHAQWLLCPLMPMLISVNSVEGSGTSVAPAVLALCIALVTKISMYATNDGHQQQLPRCHALFQYNGFPLPAARIK